MAGFEKVYSCLIHVQPDIKYIFFGKLVLYIFGILTMIPFMKAIKGETSEGVFPFYRHVIYPMMMMLAMFMFLQPTELLKLLFFCF